MTEVLIENLKKVEGGHLKAKLDVRLPTPAGDWIIRHCRIIKDREKKEWFSLPSICYIDDNGKTKYLQMLSLPPSLKRRISSQALDVWQKHKDV